MTNFRLNQKNLNLKNLNFDNELKLLDSNLEEIKKITDEDEFWKKTQLIFESIIKLYRYETVYVKYFRHNKFNYVAYYFTLYELIEEYFFGIKTIKTEIPITDENQEFLIKIYPNKFYEPHIAILDLDCDDHTRVFLTEEIPQTRKDLKFSTNFKKFKRHIEYCFPIDNIEDSIITWANEINEDGITNWDYAKNVYRIVNNFKGNFKSKKDKFKSHSKKLGTKAFKNKFKKRLKSNNRLHKFQLRKLPLTSPIIKFLNSIELPKNFNIIDECSNIGHLTGEVLRIIWSFIEKKNYIQFIENIIWDRTIKVFKKLRIINKYYKTENFIFDNILYFLSFDSIFRILFNASRKGLESRTFNFNQSFVGSTDFLDPIDPNIRIYDESLNELGKLFITNEIPQTEADLRFSEDSDKGINPKILSDIVKFANTDNNWEIVKDYWRERHFIGNEEKDYPWFKSKNEQFSIK